MRPLSIVFAALLNVAPLTGPQPLGTMSQISRSRTQGRTHT
jgi:hypothetical protein